jgi:3-deoxy-D-manno-octulosonic-acid transferase
MIKPRLVYTFSLWLLLPYVFFHLVWRARKQPEYLRHIAERFGFYSIHCSRPIIWLHTVSVGETRAAATLVNSLLATYPNHQLLLTHTTPTGRTTSEQLYRNNVLRIYLPYDYPFAVRRFLQHFRPVLGILLETEIWFNLIYQCHTTSIPLLLLNARLSEKSAARYARYPQLTQSGLQKLAAVAAQSDADAARLTALGARNVSVMGNLKFDIEPPHSALQLGKHLRELFGPQRKIFLAASTREGEEELLIEAIKQTDISGLLVVIVPRHPQRFNEVASLLDRHGMRFQRRSENHSVSPGIQVVLGDSMGEMFAYYTACDLAFIGGSLLPFGGQNLIEACAVGTPVLIGPHTYNFTQASEQAVDCGAAQRLVSIDALPERLWHLFTHPDELAAMAERGKSFVKAHRGATNEALRIIGQHLPA